MSDSVSAIKLLQIGFSTAKTIKSLVAQEIIDVLGTIGDAHARAGIRVLVDDLPYSNDPKIQLTQIIGHFNASIEFYLETIKKIRRNQLNHVLDIWYLAPRVDLHFKKFFFCAIFIAFCYKLLGETALEKNYYLKSRNYFYDYAWYSLHDYATVKHYRDIQDISLYVDRFHVNKYPIDTRENGKPKIDEIAIQNEEIEFIELSKNIFSVPSWNPTCRTYQKTGSLPQGRYGSIKMALIYLYDWRFPGFN
jgi:hypothetical protein